MKTCNTCVYCDPEDLECRLYPPRVVITSWVDGHGKRHEEFQTVYPYVAEMPACIQYNVRGGADD